MLNPDHLDYHIVATTFDTGGVSLRKGWPVAIFLQNMLKWQSEFYQRSKTEPQFFGPEGWRTKKFNDFVNETANPHRTW